MSFDNFLNQTCTINQPTADVTHGRYNENIYSSVVVGADVRCRLVEKSVKLLDEKTSEYSWIKATVLLLPAGTSILPLDEVTIGEDKWLVKQPLKRTRGNAEHHVSAIVEALNG